MVDTRGILVPESLAFLEQIKQIGCTNLSIEEARKWLESFVALYGGPREEIPYIEDILIPSEQKTHSFYVRIYHPEVSSRRLPLMLYVHGGGWTRGNLLTHDKICRFIAKRCHIRLVSVDYRLAPENPFPKGLEDALSAYHWCLKNQDRLAIDTNRIVISGDSGGGTIGAALTCLLKSMGDKLPKVLMLFYPSLDLTGSSPSMNEFATGYFLTKEAVEHYTTNYIGPDHTIATHWKISPLFFTDWQGFPTTCILIGGADPIRDDGIRFEEKLRQAGVTTEFICLDGTLHAFLQLYDFFKPQCEQAYAWVEETLRKVL